MCINNYNVVIALPYYYLIAGITQSIRSNFQTIFKFSGVSISPLYSVEKLFWVYKTTKSLFITENWLLLVVFATLQSRLQVRVVKNCFVLPYSYTSNILLQYNVYYNKNIHFIFCKLNNINPRNLSQLLDSEGFDMLSLLNTKRDYG